MKKKSQPKIDGATRAHIESRLLGENKFQRELREIRYSIDEIGVQVYPQSKLELKDATKQS